MRNIFTFIPERSKFTNSNEYQMYKYFSKHMQNSYGIACKQTILEYNNDDQSFYITVRFPELKKVKINENDIFVIRKNTDISQNSINAVKYINEHLKKKLDLKVYGNTRIRSLCDDKYLEYLFFNENKLPTPKTYYVPKLKYKGELDHIKENAKKLGYPFIIKPLDASRGNGVIKVVSEDQLSSICELIYTKYKTFLMQEYIEAEYDVRFFLFNDRILGTMRRNMIQNDFRCNYSKGSITEIYTPNQFDLNLVKTLIESLKSKFEYDMPIGTIGADLIISKKDGKPYFLEINSSPGMEGISLTYKKSFPKIVAHQILKNEGIIK